MEPGETVRLVEAVASRFGWYRWPVVVRCDPWTGGRRVWTWCHHRASALMLAARVRGEYLLAWRRGRP